MSQPALKQDDETYQALILAIGNHYFCAFIHKIQDVIERIPVTPVPRANESIVGVLNLRGHIVTEIDVASVLGIKSDKAKTKQSGYAIVIEKNNEMFSMAFDNIGDVISIQTRDIERLPETIDQKWLDVSKGVYRMGDKLVVCLDFDLMIDSIAVSSH